MSCIRRLLVLAAAVGVAACSDAATSFAPHPQVAASDLATDPQAVSTAPISTGGTGWQASVAIDGAGRSVAVWMQRTTTDALWSKARPANGQWGPHSVITATLGSGAAPVVEITTAGVATTVWTENGGVWTADRSAAGVWGPPQLLLPGAREPLFVMNSQGDAAVLWSSSSGGGPNQVNARRRQGGGAWGALEVVASGSLIELEHAAIAESTGEVIVTWERFTAPCWPYCLNNFVLHVSRAAKGSATWQDSGPLTPPAPTAHEAYPTIDAAGRAAVVYGAQQLVAIHQAAAGAAWSPPVSLHSSLSLGVAGIEVDLAGHATVALLDRTKGQVVAISGNLVNNTWSPPANVSAGDQSPSLVTFALGTGGAAVLAWSSGSSSSSNRVRVAVRRTSGGAWSAPRTISPPGIFQGTAESAAVNASGKGVVIFSAYSDATLTVHTEWATNNY